MIARPSVDPNTRVRSYGGHSRSRVSGDVRVLVLAYCACPFVPRVVWSSPAKVRIGISLRCDVAAPDRSRSVFRFRGMSTPGAPIH